MNIQPSYLNLYRTGELKDRIKTANLRLASCSLCPRNCGINREISRRITLKEYKEVLNTAHRLGLERGWQQEI